MLAARNLAVKNIHDRQKYDKTLYNKRHRHVEFDVGEQVKVFYPVRKVGKPEKLLLRWEGPYYIVGKIGDVDHKISKGKALNAETKYCLIMNHTSQFPIPIKTNFRT